MILLVWAHPDLDSLTASVVSALGKKLKETGLEVRIVDLYRFQNGTHFPGVLDETELRRKTSLDPAVQTQMRLVEEASGYAVVHPDWWGGPPAVLKGWIDRVFRPGTGYEVPEGFGFRSAGGLLTGRRAAVLICGDAAAPGPLKEFWIDRVWGFCGVDGKLSYISGVRDANRLEREIFIREETDAASAFLSS